HRVGAAGAPRGGACIRRVRRVPRVRRCPPGREPRGRDGHPRRPPGRRGPRPGRRGPRPPGGRGDRGRLRDGWRSLLPPGSAAAPRPAPPIHRTGRPMTATAEIDALLHSHLSEQPVFLIPGVLFRDITPLLRDAAALRTVIRHWSTLIPEAVDVIIGTEARGFVLGAPLAYETGAGFVPVRKAATPPGEPAGLP